MELTFAPKGILQIDNARIIWTNFSGAEGQYNREGERFFTWVIPDMEVAEALLNDKNRDGESWNVRIKEPRTPEEDPFITLKVKVKFSDYGPRVYLKSGERTIELNEDTIGSLDNMEIENIDMDIRPFDGVANGKPFRAAYLHSMEVTQRLDRFAARYSDDFAE